MMRIHVHKSHERSRGQVGVCLLALVLLCAAGPVRSQGDGGTQSVFSIGAGSRAISLGRAFVPIADDASALYWNPAALTNVRDGQVMLVQLHLL